MLRTSKKVLVATAAIAAAATACSSSGSSGGGASGGNSKTFKIGVLTDVTGVAASGEAHIVDGVKAGISVAAKDGFTISYVVADSQTSPTAVLAAAQKLVTQDHVDAVLGSSALLYGAAAYLTQQNIPVVGFAEDGPEWITAKNMFSIIGALDTTKVTTTFGKFFKDQGATTIGALGYQISPSSAESAKAAGVAAQAVGLKAGYINDKFPFGSTDVQPVAIAMKHAGVDALAPQVDPNTTFALIGALRNLGVKLKAAVVPIGYGGDLLDAGAATLQAADGVFFVVYFEPVEMNTPGTQAFLAALKSVGGTDHPGLPVYTGYTSILLLEQGLKAAGAHPSKQALITALSNVHSFDAGGLLGKPFDPNDRTGNAGGPNNCFYIVKLVGKAFQLVKGAEPVCGTIIPGKTVKP